MDGHSNQIKNWLQNEVHQSQGYSTDKKGRNALFYTQSSYKLGYYIESKAIDTGIS